MWGRGVRGYYYPNGFKLFVLGRTFLLMALDIRLKETHCCHFMGYLYQLTARALDAPIVEHQVEWEIA